jgi:hypothetical protein
MGKLNLNALAKSTPWPEYFLSDIPTLSTLRGCQTHPSSLQTSLEESPSNPSPNHRHHHHHHYHHDHRSTIHYLFLLAILDLFSPFESLDVTPPSMPIAHASETTLCRDRDVLTPSWSHSNSLLCRLDRPGSGIRWSRSPKPALLDAQA